MIQYTIWSDVYRCEGFVTIEESTGKTSTRGKNAGKPITKKRTVARGCGADVVLWYAMQNPDDLVQSSEKHEFCCALCKQLWEKVNLPFVRITPIAADYVFQGAKSAAVRIRRNITAPGTSENRRSDTASAGELGILISLSMPTAN